MPHRDFDAARQERLRQREADPISFTLGGETFTCPPIVPIGEAFDLADAPEPSANQAGAARAATTFIEAILAPEDRPRLHDALRRRDSPVDAEAIFDVMDYLAQEYTNRPTEPSTDSSGGRPNAGELSSNELSPEDSALSPTSTSVSPSTGFTE